MKNVRKFLGNYLRPAIFGLIALTGLVGLLWFDIASLPGGISATEAMNRMRLLNESISFGSLLENPLYLPYDIALFLLQAFNISSVGALRSVSALMGLILVGAFYLLLRQWHTVRVALLGTILLASSSWFLHVARFGGTNIMFTVLILFLLAGMWLDRSPHRMALLSFLLLLGALIMYIPGMIWFVAIATVWQRKRLADEFKNLPTWFIVTWIVLGFILLAPLVWSISQNPNLIKPLLALPDELPSFIEFLKGLLILPIRLFIRGPESAELWLGRLPLLDFFSTIMFIIGAYWYGTKIRLDRAKFIFGSLLLGAVLIALGGPLELAFFIPFVYLIVTAGITYMLQQWFSVFPNNPIARTIGTTLLSIAVLVTAFYHVNHYYIAWPNAPETRSAYQQQP